MKTQTSLTLLPESCKEIHLFILSLDHVLQRFIDLKKKKNENGVSLKKARGKQYPAKTMTDENYADDLALLPSTLAKAESLLHWLLRECKQNRGTCILSIKEPASL